jgi:hypothetical protein
MPDRQWWGPTAATLVFGYFLAIYLLDIAGASGPFVKAFMVPGSRALLAGAPLLEPLGMAHGSWIGGIPTDVGNLVLAILYAAAAWALAGASSTLCRR